MSGDRPTPFRKGQPPSAFGFETRMIHAGTQPEPVTGARQTPIFQNTSYVFHDADHAASLFNLQTFGFIYSRLTNPTVSALEERIASLEGGRGATCCASGHAAQILTLFAFSFTVGSEVALGGLALESLLGAEVYEGVSLWFAEQSSTISEIFNSVGGSGGI